MNWLKLNSLHLMAIISLMLVAHGAQSAVLIDDFTTAQSVLNGSTGPVNVTGTQLGNLTRTITATPSPGDADTKVDIKNSFLNISNDMDSTGTASIFYSFGPTDLASVADGLLFNINFIDFSFDIQLLANETSTFGFANMGGLGLHEIAFSQFSNPGVFANLTSLRLNFRGPQGWDASLGLLSTDTNNVPEPSTVFLLLLGLAVLSKARFISPRVQYTNAL